MNSRAELYFRFLRRRIVADFEVADAMADDTVIQGNTYLFMGYETTIGKLFLKQVHNCY